MMSIHEKIRDILLEHKGRENAVASVDIANKIGTDAGASKVKIRKEITQTIIKYKLPIASTGKGYYMLEDNEKDLKRYQKSLDNRAMKIVSRKYIVTDNFNTYYGKGELEFGGDIFFEDIDEEDEEDDKE